MGDAAGNLVFGIAEAADVTSGRARLLELCAVLSQVTSTKVVGHRASGYPELARAMAVGEVDLAWMPPLPLLRLEDEKVASALALPVRRGSTSYHTSILTRPGGPKTLAELRGTRAVWVDRESASGYVIPRLHLNAAGLELEDFFKEESFVASHDAVVDALLAGRADVGAAYCVLDAQGKLAQAAWTSPDGTRVRPVQVIAQTGPIPNDAVVVANRVPVAIRTQLLRWLLDDGAPSELLRQLMRADGFRVASPDHYASLRRLLLAARARGSMPQP